MDKKIKENNVWWKKEFQYLLDRKILTGGELAFLFGEIKAIIDHEKAPLLSHIHSLESKLNIEWDEERVREIEKWLKEEMPFPVTAEEHWKACKYVIYLLSLLKRERVEKKELEKILGEGSMEIRLLQARERIKELEERITELEANELRFPTLAEFSNLQDDHEKAEARIKELEEGIKKHKNHGYGNDDFWDEELYKLVEKK